MPDGCHVQPVHAVPTGVPLQVLRAHVRVEERSDRRTVFCNPQCEREYWRHRDRYERKKNIAQGHVTTPSWDRIIMDRAF